MNEMLIVDDERFAAEGIRNCWDWKALGVDEVHLAFSADEARRIFSERRIDVLVCDIEMPDEDGLSLVRWVKEQSPHTESVFLTCHGEFHYAQEAIHLGSFDYLLKPVDAGELSGIVGRMLERIRRKEEQIRQTRMFEKYYSLWNKQQPLLAERFWQDLLSRRILPFGDFLELALEGVQIGLHAKHPVMPILISIEEWKKELQDRDQEVMEYAVKKAAEECFLGSEWEGEAVREGDGVVYVMAYSRAGRDEAAGTRRWAEAARRFVDICEDYFYCRVSCYIGRFTPLQELPAFCAELREMERRNVAGGGSVFRYRAAMTPESASPPSAAATLNVAAMTALLMNGERQKAAESIGRTVGEWMRSCEAGPKQLEAAMHDLLQAIYHFLAVKGIQVHEIPNFSAWSGAHVRNWPQFENWAVNLVTAVMDAVFDKQESDGFVQQAIQFMRAHVEDNISREDVAAHVKLNPAYLSRLFKRETGMNLIDYLIGTKMERGKQLLEWTDMTVSAIAMQVGYSNFSHFAKMFKKQYGVNPQHYRQRARN
jgi:two-component system response regulator YesN